MQTFLRLMLLGACAAIGVTVAVDIALRTEPREQVSNAPATIQPDDARPAPIPPVEPEEPDVAPVPLSQPVSVASYDPAFEPETEAEAEPDEEPVPPVAATNVLRFRGVIQRATLLEEERPAEPPRRRISPFRPPVASQIEAPAPVVSGPVMRSVPKRSPLREPEEDREDAEPLPLPPASQSGLPIAEVHKNERDGSITLNVQNAELRNVLRLLSENGPNILASKNVQGTVSASVSGVDVEAALKAILQSTGFQSRREGKFVYVGTPQDFLEMEQLKDKLGTRIYRTNYVKAADLQTLITPMLTEKVGKLTVSTPSEVDITASTTHTGGNSFAVEEVIMVRDYEAVLAQVDQIVEEVDRRPQQVAIEAMILTVKLDDAMACGVDFSALRGANNAALFSGSPLTTLAAVDVSKGGLKFGFLDSSIGNFITALETVGDTTVVASPKLMCLNKQRAEILIGQQLGYINSTVTETSTTQAVQFLEVGTQLRIRPFISRDGMVRMEVHPELSTGNVKVVGAFTLPDKVVTQVTTNIMCRDGCAVVIGGLIRQDMGKNYNQVPVLGSMPVLGPLFRRKAETNTRDEIIIVITPRIVSEPELTHAGGQVADEFLRRQEVYAENMSPIGKRYFARNRLRAAQEAWATGNTKSALRNIKLSIQLDPLNLEAIRLRDEIMGTATWSEANEVPPEEVQKESGPAEIIGPQTSQAPPTRQEKQATFEAPTMPVKARSARRGAVKQ